MVPFSRFNKCRTGQSRRRACRQGSPPVKAQDVIRRLEAANAAAADAGMIETTSSGGG